MDIHAGQIQGSVTLPFDNLYAIKLHIDHLQKFIFKDLTSTEINNRFILISPDVGGSKRIRDFAQRLQMSHTIMDKQRDYSQANIVEKSILIGDDVKGKTGIIIDDMADTMGTMIAVNDLELHGIKDVIILVTHGLLSNPAIDRINACDKISQVIVTDTIDQSLNLTRSHKLKVVSTASLFGEVIKRLSCGGSISELFD
jgi:ribose-phosphate pyrophosphokinase